MVLAQQQLPAATSSLHIQTSPVSPIQGLQSSPSSTVVNANSNQPVYQGTSTAITLEGSSSSNTGNNLASASSAMVPHVQSPQNKTGTPTSKPMAGSNQLLYFRPISNKNRNSGLFPSLDRLKPNENRCP